MKQRQKQKLRRLEQALAETTQPQIPKYPIEFCTKILGFTPTAYQKDLIQKFQTSQFIAARWCHQSGKSQTISALLLHYALTNPNTQIGIVGPSWRQTKLVIKRINTFLTNSQKTYTTNPNKPQSA